MKKAKLLLLLLGASLLIGILAASLQFNPPYKTIIVSEEERASLLTEDWSILPSPFEGTAQLGVYNISEHEIILDTSLPIVPEKLMVYDAIKPVLNEEFAHEIAEKFAFTGELIPTESDEERWAYVFTNDTYALEVEWDGSVRFYRKTLPKTGTLPTEEECIYIAEKWLKEHDVYPSNISRGEVGVRLWYNSKPIVMGVRFWTKIGEYPLQNLGTYVGISYGGSIHEIMMTVYEFQPYANLKLKPPNHALKILKAYLDSGGIPPKGQKLNCLVSRIAFKRFIVNKISLEYYCGKNYIQPVYIFRGEANGENFEGIVDAVDRSGSTSVLLLFPYSIGYVLAWDEGVAMNDNFDGDFWPDAPGFIKTLRQIEEKKGGEK